MQPLDVVLFVAVVVFAVTGYRRGFLTAALYFVGLAAGALIGMQIAPPLARRFVDGSGQALLGIVIVLVCASIGQVLGTTVGSALRSRITWSPARQFDAIGGALVSAFGMLVIAWLIATEVKDSAFTGLARQVRGSIVLAAVDNVMPPAPDVTGQFRQLVSRDGFPEVFAGIGSRGNAEVPPPDPKVLTSRAVVTARSRILKVTGVARACSRKLEGTGFVFARRYVMTNAHVLSGVRDPQVELPGGGKLPARVVLFDPKRDVAVLFVERLTLAPLAFTDSARSGASAVVAGYPEDGPFTAVAARVREEIVAVGRDIYDRGTVRRRVYSVRARVRPGNSGGPLLAADGRVYGVVFAAAADNPDTGYALTAEEVAGDAKKGRELTKGVPTGRCS
ncbi:MAG TPA: MarP family serine protease [Mycobacteriales bacterium]|nr:MarP family serine protease [Mycobacteriales bacterium]